MKSIRSLLNSSLVAGLGVLFGAGALGIWFHVRSMLIADVDDALQTDASMLAAQMLSDAIEPDADQNHADEEEDVAEFERADPASCFEIWRDNGETPRRSHWLGERDLPRLAPLSGNVELHDVLLPDGRRARAAALRFGKEGGAGDAKATPASLRASGLVVIARDLDRVDATLGMLRMSLLVVVGGSLAGAALLVTLLLRRGLRPLERLTREAGEFRIDELARRFDRRGAPRELLPIYDRLNALLEHVEEAFARERRFTDAVAHELRTPIAELRAGCEVAMRWPDAGEKEAAVKSALDVALQMEHLVTRLLVLRRVEAGHEAQPVRSVVLRDLVEAAWERELAPSRAKGLRLTWSSDEEGRIEADDALLQSLVSNLVENAVAHAPAGSPIDCRIARADGRFRLDLANPAPDLTADDLPHLFEPFWRKDRARSDGSHAGLGLTLARAFARALGYELASELDERAWLVMSLTGEVASPGDGNGAARPPAETASSREGA